MINLAGKRAVSELLRAVDDPRAMAGVHPPIEQVCKCLQPYAPKAKSVVPKLIACLPQLKSSARAEVTSLLISIGTEEGLIAVADNLETGNVEDDKQNEISLLHSLRQRAKPLKRTAKLFEAVSQRMSDGNRKPEEYQMQILLRLDASRAIAIFSEPSWLSVTSPFTPAVLRAFHDARVRMPADLLHPLLDGLKTYQSADGIPGHNAYGSALMVLARSAPGLVAPLIAEAVTRPDSNVYWGACKATAVLHGVEDAGSFVSNRRCGPKRQDRFSWLSKEQQYYLVAYYVDAEVCNGGWEQFFNNPSGRLAQLAPDALEAIGAPRTADIARSALVVLADAGGYEPRETLDERLHDEPIAARLNTLCDEFYDFSKRHEYILSLLNLYAAKNSKHFRPVPQR